MTLISPKELKTKIDNTENFQLVDIREDYEYESYNIGGINIPLNDVFSSLEKMDTDIPIIFCCNSGKKSKAVLHTIKRKLNKENIFSLDGGLEAYAAEITDKPTP